MPTSAARSTFGTDVADPWSVTLPTGIEAGHLLLMHARGHGGTTFNTLTGWTALISNDLTDASDDPSSIWWRLADGSEGSTVSVDLGATMRGAAIVHRITGAADPTIRPPELAGPSTGAGANVDPPSITPAGGPKDFLIVVFAGMDGETQTYSAAPSGYSNLTAANSGTAGSPGGNVRLASATREANLTSEDPGAFTSGAPESGWSGWTVAIHPGQTPPFANVTVR